MSNDNNRSPLSYMFKTILILAFIVGLVAVILGSSAVLELRDTQVTIVVLVMCAGSILLGLTFSFLFLLNGPVSGPMLEAWLSPIFDKFSMPQFGMPEAPSLGSSMNYASQMNSADDVVAQFLKRERTE